MLAYSHDSVRERFLQEYARVKESQGGLTDAAFSKSIGRARNFISQLTNPKGTKYIISTEDLYYACALHKFDLNFVLFGVRVFDVMDIPELTDLKRNGRWGKK